MMSLIAVNYRGCRCPARAISSNFKSCLIYVLKVFILAPTCPFEDSTTHIISQERHNCLNRTRYCSERCLTSLQLCDNLVQHKLFTSLHPHKLFDFDLEPIGTACCIVYLFKNDHLVSLNGHLLSFTHSCLKYHCLQHYYLLRKKDFKLIRRSMIAALHIPVTQHNFCTSSTTLKSAPKGLRARLRWEKKIRPSCRATVLQWFTAPIPRLHFDNLA